MSTDLDPPEAAIIDAFHRAATYPSSSKARKLLRAPMRCVAVKIGAFIGSRTGLSLSVNTATFWGANMRIRLPEAVSNQLFCCGLFEPSMTAFMLQVLRKGHAFVDIGAHYGYFTLLAARLVGGEGRVDGFEPTPSTFEVLASNVQSLSNVFANQTAIWSEPGELTVVDLGSRLAAYNSVFTPRLGGKMSAGRNAAQIRVRATSLDDYCASEQFRPDFVKIDAESAEHRILQGMERVLTEDRPFVSLEVGDFDLPDVPPSSSMLQGMINREYVPFEYAGGAIRPHVVRASYEYDNILLAPLEHPFTRKLSTP